MKNVIISFCLFALLIITILFSVKFVNNSCNELIMINNNIEKAVAQEDWDLAKKNSIDFSTAWERHSNIITMFIHHQEIDNVCMEMSKEQIYVDEKNQEETLSNLNTIHFLLDHISKMENISIQNIF